MPSCPELQTFQILLRAGILDISMQLSLQIHPHPVLCIRCTQNLECGSAALQVFGKFNIAETLRQQGINPCTIAEGKNADAQFPFSDWTPEQERLVNSLVDHIYAGFVRKVKAFLLF